MLDEDSGRFRGKNDELNHVGQTEADYTARNDSFYSGFRSILLHLQNSSFIKKKMGQII